MDSREPNGPEIADRTAAVSLDIAESVAAHLDDLLREFAEDAGLETVLVVDRSGALVSGVSAEEEVTVEVISALVAGASGAMRALVARIGETGAVESLHLGGNRLIYLKEVARDFILVAVADASRPAGLVREKARDMDELLADLLREVRPSEPPAEDSAFLEMRSLRGIADDRGADLDSVEPIDSVDAGAEQDDEGESLLDESEDPPFDEKGEPPFEPVLEAAEAEAEHDDEGASPPAEFAAPPFDGDETPLESVFEVEEDPDFLDDESEEDFAEPVDARAELEEELEIEVDLDSEPAPALEAESGAKPVVEPRGVLEPLDLDELEIVIEPTPALSRNPGVAVPPVDSPFEADAEVDEEGEIEDGEIAPTIESVDDSVFELEGGEPEDEFDREDEFDFSASLAPEPPRSLFELDEEPEDPGDAIPQNVFELEDEDDWDDEIEDWGEVEAPPVAETRPPALPASRFPEPPVPPEPSAATAESEEPGEDSGEDITQEIDEMIAEEEEEDEVRSSGPFYF